MDHSLVLRLTSLREDRIGEGEKKIDFISSPVANGPPVTRTLLSSSGSNSPASGFETPRNGKIDQAREKASWKNCSRLEMSARKFRSLGHSILTRVRKGHESI